MGSGDDGNLTEAIRNTARAYGVRLSIGTDWCIAWGGEDANDCAGRLEYDDEAEAREMTQWIEGGIVARQAVIRLPWETVPDAEASDGHRD
jgi:hypothetical protein